MARQIVIRDDGTPDGDPLARISVHPAAELFPLIHGAEFDELVRDIAEHGQRDAIVFTPDNQLLDGRNRWRACAVAGAAPITRVEESEPWAYVISTNLHRRHLSESQRAMVAAKVQTRGPGGPRRAGEQAAAPIGAAAPRRADVAKILNVGTSTIDRAREVQRHGTPALQDAVEAGAISVYTAARTAKEMSPAEQDDFVRRVDNGAHPVKLASTLDVSSRYRDAEPATPAAPRNQWSPKRHRAIQEIALRSLSDSLGALDLLLNNTPDGLDTSLTPPEAARWADDLRKGRRALNRVIDMLNNRKEITL